MDLSPRAEALHRFGPRTTPPFGEDGVSALFHNHNRSKRSLAIDEAMIYLCSAVINSR